MKSKYIIPYISAGALALLASCNLDYEPVGDYSDATIPPTDSTEEASRFQSKDDVDSYLQNSIIQKYHDRQEHWYLDQLLIADCHSDNAYVGTTGAEVVPYEDNSIEGSNSVMERDWDRFLEDVAVANVLIGEVEYTPGVSASEARTYQAQARLLRAMIWFNMVRLWGDIPVIKTVAGNITEDNIEDIYFAYFPKQSTELEAYEAIEEDLLFAAQYAPNGAADKSQLSKDVAYAMLAKVYAEKPIRDYSKVITYAEMLAANGYDLCDDFTDLFGMNASGTDAKTRNTVEAIYEAHYSPGSGNWVSWMFGRDELDWDNSFTWAKWVTPSRDLNSLFTSQGDNVRYSESVVWRDCTWSNYYPMDNYAFMYKYRSGANSMIKMRYADILLLKAEAYLMTDNLSAAADIIDQVRARVGLKKLTSTVRGNKENLLNAYLDERRMELCFEGQRWFDLVRLDKVEEVMNAVYAKDSGRKAQRNIFNANSYRLPIPQAAIDQNDNLVQNPGY